MVSDAASESHRVLSVLREKFTFQISVDTAHVQQGLAVAEAALAAGVTIVELGTPLLKYEGVRNVVPIFRQRFPGALLLADMKTMDGGEGEATAVYGGGGNVIDFLALAGEATAREYARSRRVPGSRSCDPQARLRRCPHSDAGTGRACGRGREAHARRRRGRRRHSSPI